MDEPDQSSSETFNKEDREPELEYQIKKPIAYEQDNGEDEEQLD